MANWIYLSDANVLITAERDYYPREQVPEFWEWLHFKAAEGRFKMPSEILDEVLTGQKEDDPLLDWLRQTEVADALRLEEDVDPSLVQTVVSKGYAPDLNDDEVEELGRDPFIVAYAMVDPISRCVVTNEVSRPSKLRQNRKIPDVCATVGVRSINPFVMNRELGFTTSWRSKI